MERNVDFNNWKRKDKYNFFKDMQNQFFGTSFNVDITKVYKIHKDENISLYLMLIWIFTKAINSIDEFHYDFSNDLTKLIYIDERIPSFTDTNGKDDFKIVTIKNNSNMRSFVNETKEVSLKQKEFIDSSLESNSLIYFSCLPWLELTGLNSEGLIGDKHNIPRLNWGKYKIENEKVILNLSLEVNHVFEDGYHVGKFLKEVETIISNL